MPIGTCARRVSAVLLIAGLAGCGSGGKPQDSSSSSPTFDPFATSTAVSAGPPSGYDISRIAQLANAFPPDFTVEPIGPMTLTQEQAEGFAGMIKKLASTFKPPHCAEALQHPTAIAGGVMQGFAAHGPQEIVVAAAQSPQPVPVVVPPESCKHVTFNEPGKAQGSVDHIAALPIAGATVVGLKVHTEITEPGESKTVDRYQYQASLSDRVAVMLSGASDPPLLEGILAKAVAAVRGH